MGIFALPRLVVYGTEALDLMIEEAKMFGERVFIVSDRVIEKLGFLERVKRAFEDAGFLVEFTVEVEEEPSFSNVESIARRASQFKPDIIVAIGGGSVIDAAKGVWVRLENPGYDLYGISPLERIGVGKKVRLIAIPTTSGTGSEATFGIVLSEKVDGKRKYALGSYEIVPWMAVLHPEFPSSMPRSLTIGTGLDALAHALEALVSSTASDFTDALAVKSAEIIFSELPRVVEEPKNLDLRGRIHMAAMMAGMAFSNSGLGLAHAIAHTLGPMLGVHHGAIVASILPYVVKFNSERSEGAAGKYRLLERVLNAVLGQEMGLLERIVDLYQTLGHPLDLESYGCSLGWIQDNRDEIVAGVFSDPDLGFNPVLPSEEDVLEVLNRAVEGRI